MHILIVDDSAFARERLGKLLETAGHSVREAGSGPEALDLFAQARPDAVTVDLLMPEMDGLELVRRLRGLDPTVPIIVVSADIQEATRKEVLAAGALAFVGKGGKLSDVIAAVNMALGVTPLPAWSARQQDAFTELINIAMGHAAAALSNLLDCRVVLNVPKVEIMPATALANFFDREVTEIGAVVAQQFSGQVNGVAALVFPRQHAVTLIRALLGVAREPDQLSSAEQTVLAEVGNVVLNTALAMLGDQMQARLAVGLPIVALKQTGAAATGLLLSSAPDADHALVLLSRLSIGEAELIVYLIIAMPQGDVRRLLCSLGV